MGTVCKVRSGRSGFTLLELMFAMTVMTVGLVAAFGGQIGTHNVIRQARETQLVLTRLETAMEYVLTQQAEDLPTNPLVAHDQVIAFGEDLGLNQLQLVATYQDYEAGFEVPDPLHITITAAWTDFQGRQRDMALTSVKTR